MNPSSSLYRARLPLLKFLRYLPNFFRKMPENSYRCIKLKFQLLKSAGDFDPSSLGLLSVPRSFLIFRILNHLELTPLTSSESRPLGNFLLKFPIPASKLATFLLLPSPKLQLPRSLRLHPAYLGPLTFAPLKRTFTLRFLNYLHF